MTPEELVGWATAAVAALGVVTAAVRKAAAEWSEIKKALGIGAEGDLHALVRETHALAVANADRQDRLEAVTAGVRARVTVLEKRHGILPCVEPESQKVAAAGGRR